MNAEAEIIQKRKAEVFDRLGIRRRINHYLPEDAGDGESSGWINVQESVESDHEEDVTTAVTTEAPRRNEVMRTLPTSVGQPLEKKRRHVVFSTPADIDARRRKKRQTVADEANAVLEESTAQ